MNRPADPIQPYAAIAQQCERRAADAHSQKLKALWAEEADLWRMLQSERAEIARLVEIMKAEGLSVEAA